MVVVLALIELLIVVLLVLVILPFSSLLMLLLRGFGGTAGGTEEFFVPAEPERLIFPLPEFRSVVFSGDIDRFGRASELMTGEDLAEAEGLNFKRPK